MCLGIPLPRDRDAELTVVPAGRETFWSDSCEGVLLHVLEELSQHLGHAQITADVLAVDGENSPSTTPHHG